MAYFPQKQGNSPFPKAAVLREEFVGLTHDPLVAIVLNQLLYWTQRVKDFDLHLQEEQFFNSDCNVSPRHGWIYKTANDLIEETMICVDRTTMRRYLKFLMDQGWLEERSHPRNKWDKTSQYRLNLRKLQKDLLSLGFELPGIELFLQKEFIHKSDAEDLNFDVCEMAETSNGDFAHSKGQNSPTLQKSQENPIVQNPPSNGHSALSKEQISPSNVTNCPLYIQRIQTENKNREQAERTSARENAADSDASPSDASVPDESVPDESVAEAMVSVWDKDVGQNLPPANRQKDLQLEDKHKSQLAPLLAFHFKNDMRLWERFCLRVNASTFLMGGGDRGWWVSLEWVLKDGSVFKVLEGNFDGKDRPGQQNSHSTGSYAWDNLDHMQPNPAKQAEKAAILASIQDPTWKEWCTKLAEGVRFNEAQMLEVPLSTAELEQIANARFLECEDKRLVWIGSSDPSVLRGIDGLCHKINWVFKEKYPEARTFRTRLEASIPIHQPPIPGETHAQ
ncbi:MAG: hypothetical protein H0X26_08630 [Alphaproteobacteria bacterium]|nr:hypothetical protein [Alphaproteobacteria bacterium]